MKPESNSVEQGVIDMFMAENAMWFFNYAGDPKAPHAELTSGLCSDGYVNCRLVLSNPQHSTTLAFWLMAEVFKQKLKADWVVGSAYAAITFSYEVAQQMKARHGFVKKSAKDPKRMVWEDLKIPSGATVLQCEELITTFGTTFEVRRAIMAGQPQEGIIFLPKILTIVYRPAEFDDEVDSQVVALLKRAVKTWDPKVCPLCAQGSSRVRPAQNWAQLVR